MYRCRTGMPKLVRQIIETGAEKAAGYAIRSLLFREFLECVLKRILKGAKQLCNRNIVRSRGKSLNLLAMNFSNPGVELWTAIEKHVSYFKDNEDIPEDKRLANHEKRGQQLCNRQGGSSQRVRRNADSSRNVNEMVL
jgi:hypothetical protein